MPRKLAVHLIYDLLQYDLALKPVDEELQRRGHQVIRSRTRAESSDGDCSVMIQDVAVAKAPGKRFFITHGLSCLKGWDINLPIDYFLPAGPYWADRLSSKMQSDHFQFSILEPTGWPRMDAWTALIAKRESIRRSVIARHFLKDAPIVVYAPTYKDPAKGHQRGVHAMTVANLLSQQWNCFVLPHQMEKTHEFSGDDPRIIRRYGELRLDYLIAADVLVGDRSGLVFEFTATGKPIVLIDNPDHLNYTRLEANARGDVFDAGYWTTVERLIPTVTKALEHPGMKSDRIQYWRDQVVGPCDGQHAKRAVDQIENAMWIA